MSESSKTIANDLASPAGIQAYLQTLLDGRFAAKSVDVVSGGFANYTFRAWLETPYESTTHTRDIPVEKASVIVKYATEYAAASGSTIPLNLNRTVSLLTCHRTPSLIYYRISKSPRFESYLGPSSEKITKGLTRFTSLLCCTTMPRKRFRSTVTLGPFPLSKSGSSLILPIPPSLTKSVTASVRFSLAYTCGVKG